ncbi:MAG: ComEC/Rec2 family competence protein [Patescibacteria group bacterium]|nr:ComEC family competence protein [Patescibacteria group bacterium]
MASRRFTPAVGLRAISAGFLLGLALASYKEVINNYFWLLVFVAAILFLIIWRFEKRFIVFAITAFLALAGFWFYSANLPGTDSVASFVDQEFYLQGVVVDIKVTDKTQHLTLAELVLDNQPVADKAIVFSPLFPRLEYGDQVSLRCRLDAPQPIEGFKYDRYLAAKGIYATCFARSSPIVIAKGQGNFVIAQLLQGRQKVININDKIFGEPEASLLLGLLLGEQRFSDAWQDRFVRTGTTHIVAASGYNVAVVTSIVFTLLTFFGLRRPRAFALIIAAIFGYVILAGAEAAVIRAGVMGALVLTSAQLGRKSTMTNVLLLTASIMLLFNPFLLRDDVGFQLSMLSTIGLIYFSPYLVKHLKFIPETLAIRESITATLAATLFTLPIVIFSFGRFSLVSLFANVFILPLIPYTMFFGACAIFGGLFSIELGALLAGPAWAMLKLMLFFVTTLSELPFAVIEFSL